MVNTPDNNMIINEKIEYMKKRLSDIIPVFCKNIEDFSKMYFSESEPWSGDFSLEYLLQTWVKNAKLENIDALFRNLGIKCKFEPVDSEDRNFLYDSSHDYHANNALIINLEDISNINDAIRYFNYIFEYSERFNYLLCNIYNIPIKYPSLNFSLINDVIPLKDMMNDVITSLISLKNDVITSLISLNNDII